MAGEGPRFSISLYTELPELSLRSKKISHQHIAQLSPGSSKPSSFSRYVLSASVLQHFQHRLLNHPNDTLANCIQITVQHLGRIHTIIAAYFMIITAELLQTSLLSKSTRRQVPALGFHPPAISLTCCGRPLLRSPKEASILLLQTDNRIRDTIGGLSYIWAGTSQHCRQWLLQR